MTASPPAPDRPPADLTVDGDALVVEDQLFSIVPEWVIDSGINDAAFRVYALLLRYGNGSGVRMPSRATLATRLGRSTDSVDRAIRNLTEKGLVVIEHRHRGGVNLSNRYYVRTTPPSPAAEEPKSGGGRTSAATPPLSGSASAGGHVEGHAVAAGGGRRSAATGRTSAAGVAAEVRPDPEISTQRRTPPPPPSPTSAHLGAAREEEAKLLIDCGLDPQTGLADLAARCAAARAAHGLGAACWQPPHLLAALDLAVQTRLWPARWATAAMLRVAADPASRSPMRLAEAGPWWDEAAAAAQVLVADDDVEALEARMAELGGQRLPLQAQARAELTREGVPLTRTTVYRRALLILDRRTAS